MKAAVLEAQQRIVYQEVETPRPEPGEALLEVRAVSICGSDVSRFIHGHHTYPMILGHEVAGMVVDVGEQTDRGLIGQRAALIPLIPNMDSAQSRRGLYAAAADYAFLGSRGRFGGFAQFVTAPARNLIEVPASVSFEAAALIEPSSVAIHALDAGGLAPGQRVAVLGAGSIGLMAVQWARILGAGQIISIDVQDDKLDNARRLGAQVNLNPLREDIFRAVMELTGDGVDLAHEMAGAAAAFETAVHITRPRGCIVLTGNQPKDAVFPARLLEHITRRELRVTGSWMSYSAPFPGHEWSDTMAALLNGDLRTEPMISHRFPLSDAASVFERIQSRELSYCKIMLDPMQ